MCDARKPLPTFAALQQRNVEEQATAFVADPIEALPAALPLVENQGRNIVTSQARKVTSAQNYNVTNLSVPRLEGVARVEELSRDGVMAAHMNVRLTQEADDMIEETLYALRYMRPTKQALVSAALEIGLQEIFKENRLPPKKGT